MGVWRRLLPQTIAAQITGLLVVAVLLGIGLTNVVILSFYDRETIANQEIVAAARAARIATIVKQAEADPLSPKLGQMMTMANWLGMSVEAVPLSRLDFSSAPIAVPSALREIVLGLLKDTWGIVPLAGVGYPGMDNPIVVKVGNDEAIVFAISGRTVFRRFAVIPISSAVAIIAFLLLFVSIYGVRWITAPLSSVAAAARSFGRLPGDDPVLNEHGPREIAQVAAALNEMRGRVRSLVDERTRMLAAISHDLRTPLTRLRLRAERLGDAALREGMLDDITAVNDMLTETLTYLREGGRSEPVHRVDLPSLVQTVCAQFADIGHRVAYEGPARLPFACRAHALTRAVTNVVDNAVKHGAAVTVSLHSRADGSVRLDIADDGPGIPAALREKVFEPFFKIDAARSSPGSRGFGLGLSIARDIVRTHGGEISLSDRAPRGLVVRMTLRPGDESAAATSLNIT